MYSIRKNESRVSELPVRAYLSGKTFHLFCHNKFFKEKLKYKNIFFNIFRTKE